MSFFKQILGGHHNRGHGGSHGGRYNEQGEGQPISGTPCAGCRTINVGGARFCQQCGGSLVPASCGQCNAVMAAGAKFCSQCGSERG